MAALSSAFIIFAVIVQNTFYINKPKDVIEAFVCLKNNDSTTKCKWPEAWQRLEYSNNGSVEVFKRPLSEEETRNKTNIKYKIRVIFSNRSVGDQSDWQMLPINFNDSSTMKNQTCKKDKEEPTVISYIVLFLYIIMTFISSAIIVFSTCAKISKSKCIAYFK